MPSPSPAASPLFRQWRLLRAIASGGGSASIGSLSTATGMSDKTIRRDIDLLRRVGFPIEERVGEFNRKTYSLGRGHDELRPTQAESSTNGRMAKAHGRTAPAGSGDGERAAATGWSGIPPLSFAYDEALALYLCRRSAAGFAGTLVEQSLTAAFRKIEASLGRRAARYVETMLARIGQTQPPADYGRQAELLDRLLIAIEEDRAVFLTYRSQRSTEPVTYDVYPYRLIDHRGALYLFGYSPDHGENRTWKVDRMLKADPTEVRFQRPDDTDLSRQLAGNFGIFSGRGDVRVRILFAPGTARYVGEKRMHASQKVEPQPDGSAIVEFRLNGTTEVKAWILSFGAAAEVLEPEALRREIHEECVKLADMLGLNQATSTKRKTRAHH